MTEIILTTASATFALTMALMLTLLRYAFETGQGAGPPALRRTTFVGRMTEDWALQGRGIAWGIVLVFVAVAASGFLRLVPFAGLPVAEASAAPLHRVSENADAALRALDSYVAELDGGADQPSPIAATAAMPTGGLPDVETMIQRLEQRLESAPDDAKGWRMLGWSRLHTDDAAGSIKAYERALALEPGNAEAAAGLAEAKTRADAMGMPQPSSVEPAAGLVAKSVTPVTGSPAP